MKFTLLTFSFILSLVYSSVAQEKLKPQHKHDDIHIDWLQLLGHTHKAKKAFQLYDQKKSELTKENLHKQTKQINNTLQTLVKKGQLQHTQVTLSLDKLSPEKQTLFRTLHSYISHKYGQLVALEMMDMGFGHVLEHGFNMPDNLTLDTYLPKAQSEQLKFIISDKKASEIELQPAKVSFTKDTAPELLWLNLANDLQEYIENIQQAAKRPDADPSQFFPLIESFEATREALIEQQNVMKKTYLVKLTTLPAATKQKILDMNNKLTPLYGHFLTREMVGMGVIDMFKQIDPNYNPNQFTIFLPKKEFQELSKSIEEGIKKIQSK